ncbi:MAG: nitrate/sulfonate/bicarbonate transporter, inner rane subunit [Parcubacteria group bacterium]|nr:nitrate/sulfonate/bicarbonate transporter, inner rane subunit [Parcubacteria group bacterium]
MLWLAALWVVGFGMFWQANPVRVMPTLTEVGGAILPLWRAGVGNAILVSMWTLLEAILISSALSLGLSYLYVLAVFRFPLISATKLRFLGFTGLITLFYLATKDGHILKVAVLTFAITVFLLTDMLKVVREIPQERYNLARTLGMNRLRVVWEVVVRGTLSTAIESIRANAAIGWMMLTMVEGLSRSDGGVGVLLLNLNRSRMLENVFAVQLMILFMGVGQDYLIGIIKDVVCPYARLGKAKI